MSAAPPRPPAPAGALALIKPAVRAQPAYTLAALDAPRKLNQNESPYDVPAALKAEILARAASARWQRYPEFVPQRLLDRLSALYGWPAEGILAGNGSNELIQASLSVALEDGDAVVAPAPTFSLYRLLTNVYGGRYVPVPLRADFSYDVEAIVAAARAERAKVVVLNSPNNPTGTALPAGAVERVLEATDALVLVDEAYQDFGGPSAMAALAANDRVVVLRTFSKALGMAGLRFGVGLAQPHVARELAKAKLPYNVNLVTLAAADVLLDHAEVREHHVRRIVETRDRTFPRLAALPGITVVPTSANFFLVRFHHHEPSAVYRRLLEEHGILVRDVSGVPELRDCLRISVGTDEDMEAVKGALGSILGPEGRAHD
jgi:histidinol-phosphate aminotransferase